MTCIGLVGAGHIGSQVARQAVAHGYDVVLSNSRDPGTLAELVAELGPRARAAFPAEAAEAADIGVVTVPLRSLSAVPVEPFAGKPVIDTCNYYPGRDGRLAAIDSGEATTSELVQAHLVGAHVVKAFNSIPAGDITADARPAGAAGRRALPIAGDSPEAKRRVAALIDEFGFDVLDAGPLHEGWRFERGTPSYVQRLTLPRLREYLSRARWEDRLR